MQISISEASRNWNISRTTIHNKINQKLLTKNENWTLDVAEVSRVFWSPKKKAKKENIVQDNNLTLESTIKSLFEQQLEYERKLRIQAEKRADEYQSKLTQMEKRLDEVLHQMNNLTDTMKLLQAPQPRKKFLGIF